MFLERWVSGKTSRAERDRRRFEASSLIVVTSITSITDISVIIIIIIVSSSSSSSSSSSIINIIDSIIVIVSTMCLLFIITQTLEAGCPVLAVHTGQSSRQRESWRPALASCRFSAAR